jgi:ABC-type spermidine/putrescine transport system permease subunit II
MTLTKRSAVSSTIAASVLLATVLVFYYPLVSRSARQFFYPLVESLSHWQWEPESNSTGWLRSLLVSLGIATVATTLTSVYTLTAGFFFFSERERRLKRMAVNVLRFLSYVPVLFLGVSILNSKLLAPVVGVLYRTDLAPAFLRIIILGVAETLALFPGYCLRMLRVIDGTDPTILKTQQTLGDSGWKAYKLVILPMHLRKLLTLLVMAFVQSFCTTSLLYILIYSNPGAGPSHQILQPLAPQLLRLFHSTRTELIDFLLAGAIILLILTGTVRLLADSLTRKVARQ